MALIFLSMMLQVRMLARDIATEDYWHAISSGDFSYGNER